MAANPNVGIDLQAGAGSTPSEPVSTPATPPIESDVTKLLAGFGEKFDSLQKELRGLQGRQDKAENNFQAQLARLKQYQSQGMSEPDVLAAMQKDDAAESRWTDLNKKLDSLAERIANGGTQASGQQKVAEVFTSIGLDVKDPCVASALLTQYKTADEVELAAYRLSRQIQQSPNPNLAQNGSLNGNNPGNGTQEADLRAKLSDLQKDPVKNRKEIAEVKKQLGW